MPRSASRDDLQMGGRSSFLFEDDPRRPSTAGPTRLSRRAPQAPNNEPDMMQYATATTHVTLPSGLTLTKAQYREVFEQAKRDMMAARQAS